MEKDPDILTGEEMRRRRRGKNLAMLGALMAFVVIVYLVAIVRMSGGSVP